MENEESIITSFRARRDFRYANDRVVKKHRRKIYRLHQKIKLIWKQISEEHECIRQRHKHLSTDVAKSVAKKLASLKPNANQVYPRKVFRYAPPP